MLIHEQLWHRFETEDPEEICRRTGAEYDAATGQVRLPVLDGTLVIDPVTRCVGWLEAGSSDTEDASGIFHDPDVSTGVAATAYMISAREVPLAHRWISPLELPSGEMFFRGPHGLPTAPLEATFGDSLEAFKAAAGQLGGGALIFADAAYEFLVFPRVPIAVLLWAADDEFPARARFLVDETLSEHLALDSVLGVLEVVVDRLVQAACPRS